MNIRFPITYCMEVDLFQGCCLRGACPKAYPPRSLCPLGQKQFICRDQVKIHGLAKDGHHKITYGWGDLPRCRHETSEGAFFYGGRKTRSNGYLD
ncbi:hypothetical protein BU24DRAFT_41871 [Aaosphaeria arxii CBS 175.79]|uniref:Uncharacterized protein n=1 Tax=Aaosphaeria arxii CBS 175.79 TaxID=1450172 RepID=A0A6A5YCD4_9PLEO|nr:uncharacterized protein BU24DRAFT_41871 [Aaosphaeria arxii CBS 175.79]KAF2022284.1 hypothetical protein BU24DRAFT_41871 [Aaosphaeria arxii CBS 175.79]